jgi:hypothetical protein
MRALLSSGKKKDATHHRERGKLPERKLDLGTSRPVTFQMVAGRMKPQEHPVRLNGKVFFDSVKGPVSWSHT